MLFRTIRKYFVPHPENDHRPHILRLEAVVVMLAVVFVAEMLFVAHVFVGKRSAYLATIVANVLIDRTNDVRLAADLPALTVDPLLSRAAAMKAEDMAEKGYFAHTSPEGATPWLWFDAVGYQYARAGENLAVNFADSDDVVRAWLDSPKHRENIENGRFTDIGIGTARGTYRGQEAVFIVQLFGTPAQMPESEAPIAAVMSDGPSEGVLVPDTAPSPQPPAPSVAGADTADENAVVVLGLAEVQAEVFPQTGGPARYANFTDRMASSPRTVAQAFYLALATLVALALACVVFLRPAALARAGVENAVPHVHVIRHGVGFLVIVGVIVLLNQYASVAFASVR